MSKITNYGLTRSGTGTGCFIAVPTTHIATVGVKGLTPIKVNHHRGAFVTFFRLICAFNFRLIIIIIIIISNVSTVNTLEKRLDKFQKKETRTFR